MIDILYILIACVIALHGSYCLHKYIQNGYKDNHGFLYLFLFLWDFICSFVFVLMAWK